MKKLWLIMFLVIILIFAIFPELYAAWSQDVFVQGTITVQG